MKKYGIIGFTLLVVLVGAVAFALAQGDTAVSAADEADAVAPVAQDTDAAVPNGSNFVDEDGDGACDNCGATQPQAAMNGNQYGAANQGDNSVDENDHVAPENGAGNRFGATGGRGQDQGVPAANSNFVDEDGDGLCDSCGTASGTGSNFVDEDGDGVCDTCGAGGQQGQGNRYGQTGGQGQGAGAGQGHGGGQGNGRSNVQP